MLFENFDPSLFDALIFPVSRRSYIVGVPKVKKSIGDRAQSGVRGLKVGATMVSGLEFIDLVVDSVVDLMGVNGGRYVLSWDRTQNGSQDDPQDGSQKGSQNDLQSDH